MKISHGLPLVEAAGFKVDGTNIDLGLSPDISIGFSKTNEISTETIQMLIQDNQDKKLLCLIYKVPIVCKVKLPWISLRLPVYP